MPATPINKGRVVSFNGSDRTVGTVEELDDMGNSYSPQRVYEFAEGEVGPPPNILPGTLVNFILNTTPSISKIARDIRRGHIIVGP